jgi:integrase
MLLLVRLEAASYLRAVAWVTNSRVPGGTPTRQEMRALSPDQARALLQFAAGIRFEPLFALATGIRPSEYLGLRWTDADLQAGTVTVQRVLSRQKSEWCFTGSKTAKSCRTIPLPASVTELSAEHKRTQAEARMTRAANYTDHDLVFVTRTSLPLDAHNLIHEYFKPLLVAATLDPALRLYHLRHSCATLLLAAGENAKVVSERLGHASVTSTLDVCSHVLPTMQQRAAERIELMLFG